MLHWGAAPVKFKEPVRLPGSFRKLFCLLTAVFLNEMRRPKLLISMLQSCVARIFVSIKTSGINCWLQYTFVFQGSHVTIQGPVSIYRPSYLRMAISMLKIRRPLGRLIFNMGIAIPGKTVFLIETAPRAPSQYKDRLIYVWRFPC